MTEQPQQSSMQPLQNNYESSRPLFNNNPEIAPADVEYYDQYRYPEVLPNNNRNGKSESSGDKLPLTMVPGLQSNLGQTVLPLNVNDVQQMQQQLQQVY